MTSMVWDAIVDSIKSAIDWVKNLPGEMWEMGKNAISGFVDGIKGAANAVGDAVTNVANNVTDGIKDALDIHSPSRVMKELGKFTGEGFQIGIQDKIPEITHAVNGMTTAAVTPQEQPEPQGLAPTYNNSSASSNIIVSPKIEVTIQGGESTSTAKNTAQEVKKELENLFKSFGMKNPQFIEG